MNTKMMSADMKRNLLVQQGCTAAVVELLVLSTIRDASILLLFAIVLMIAMLSFKTIEIITNYRFKRMFVLHFRSRGLEFEVNKIYNHQELVNQGITIINKETISHVNGDFMVVVMDNNSYPLLLLSLVLAVTSIFIPHHNMLVYSVASMWLYMVFNL